MKTERVTLLATPEFKAFLTSEAQREGVTVSALVRARCERAVHPEEAELAALAAELRSAVRSAKLTLRDGLDEANSVLAELREKRANQGLEIVVSASRSKAAGGARAKSGAQARARKARAA